MTELEYSTREPDIGDWENTSRTGVKITGETERQEEVYNIRGSVPVNRKERSISDYHELELLEWIRGYQSATALRERTLL